MRIATRAESKIREGDCILKRLKKSRRELKRIDWETVKRVVGTLYYSTGMKKTILATACSMGYDKCRLYLDWLEMMDLVTKEINADGHEELLLTEKGRLLYSTKFTTESLYEKRIDHLRDF